MEGFTYYECIPLLYKTRVTQKKHYDSLGFKQQKVTFFRDNESNIETTDTIIDYKLAKQKTASYLFALSLFTYLGEHYAPCYAARTFIELN